MAALRAGVIGTGRQSGRTTGAAISHHHGKGYQALKGDVDFVACADIVRENAEIYAEQFGIPKSGIHTDYKEMLAKEKLDIVSICTWPHLHAPMVIDCAAAKVPAIYCEKPMADSWGAAKRMHQACMVSGTKLAFSHQRRFSKVFRNARKLIDEGALGQLQQVQFNCGDIYDFGTHCIDLCNYLNGERAAKWVMAQIDYRELKVYFGAHVENQALVQWEYENGVYGLGSTGPAGGFVGALLKAVGSDGVFEVASLDPAAKDKPALRYRRFGKGDWEYVDTEGDGPHGGTFLERAIADFVAHLKRGETNELSSTHALRATEIIFAAYHSSRISARVDLPLYVDNHPLVAMLEEGRMKPIPKPPEPTQK